MTLYKALTNFTFEEVIVIHNGSIIFKGEAWRFNLKDYWLKMVYNINISYYYNISYSDDNPSAIISLTIGE